MGAVQLLCALPCLVTRALLGQVENTEASRRAKLAAVRHMRVAAVLAAWVALALVGAVHRAAPRVQRGHVELAEREMLVAPDQIDVENLHVGDQRDRQHRNQQQHCDQRGDFAAGELRFGRCLDIARLGRKIFARQIFLPRDIDGERDQINWIKYYSV